MKGRKREPTKLKMIKGNRGRRPLPANEPEPVSPDRLLMPAEYLGAERWAEIGNDLADDVWRLIAPDLHVAGILTRCDYMAAISMSIFIADWMHALALMKRAGRYRKNENGEIVPSVFWKQAKASWNEAARLMGSFGMTPSDRAKVQTTLSQNNDREKEDIYIKRG